ncbi:ABC-2 type transport system permease protein [Antricoccus suffuscus]|uniref:Transport permease protein n=2 Tax=Antricoccus suffuscus TaxID=1629062 RepID=A0A2T0ZFW2_9ACTN|nr:ABC-2 type transport system permease protein [Antricoccus suffuscus]
MSSDAEIATVTRVQPAKVSYGPVAVARVRAEIYSFFREKSSLVFTLIFPVFLLIIFGALFGNSSDVAPGVGYINYLVPGMIAAGLMTTSFQNLAITIPIERDSGLLKRLRGTPMPKSAYFLGKVILVLILSLISTILMLVVALIFYDVSLPATVTKWLVFLAVLLLGVAACTLVGIAFSSIPKTGRGAPAMVTPIALLLQFISGVFLPFTQLPDWLQTIGALFPLKWMAQGLRYVFLPDAAKAAEAAHSFELDRVFLLLGAWAVVGLVLCVLTFRWRTKTDG